MCIAGIVATLIGVAAGAAPLLLLALLLIYSGWLFAFFVMAAGGLMGPIAIWWSRRQRAVA